MTPIPRSDWEECGKDWEERGRNDGSANSCAEARGPARECQSQAALAEAAGVTQQSISKVGPADICPHDRLKLRLATVLDVPPAECSVADSSGLLSPNERTMDRRAARRRRPRRLVPLRPPRRGRRAQAPSRRDPDPQALPRRTRHRPRTVHLHDLPADPAEPSPSASTTAPTPTSPRSSSTPQPSSTRSGTGWTISNEASPTPGRPTIPVTAPAGPRPTEVEVPSRYVLPGPARLARNLQQGPGLGPDQSPGVSPHPRSGPRLTTPCWHRRSAIALAQWMSAQVR